MRTAARSLTPISAFRPLPARDRSQAAVAPAHVFPRLEISSASWRPELPGGGPVRQRWLDVNGALVAAGGADRGGWWMHWPHLATYVFRPRGDVFAHPAPGSTPADITDSYTRGVLPVVLLAQEHEALHASGVSHGGSVTAFCARSGTGKSALAFAAAVSGARYWADDTVVLHAMHDGVDALSLRFPARVDDAVRGCLGSAAHDVRAVAPGVREPLGRVYLLVRDVSVGPHAPVFLDVPRAERFERLLAHAHPFDLSTPDRRRRMIQRWMRAAATVRVCELRFAPSLPALPALAARLHDHMRAG